MKHVIYKIFTAWDFDKEEEWLNQMSAEGLHLVDVYLFRYVFVDGDPGEYKIRLELLENTVGHPISQRYINFLADTGVEYIGNVMRWAYFRKKATDGSFDLFSDLNSRINHLGRILALLFPIFLIEIVIGMNNFVLFAGLVLHDKRYLSNMFSGTLCLALGIIIGFGLIKIYKKRSVLKKERALHE